MDSRRPTAAKLRWAAVCAFGLLLFAGCSDTTGTSVPKETTLPVVLASTITATSTTPVDSSSEIPSSATSEPPDGEWIAVRPTFESRGMVEGEPIQPQVESFVRLAGSYWALGDIGGRAAIWRSEDLVDFGISYLDPTGRPRAPGRFTRLRSMVEFDGKLVAGGPTRISRPELERSVILVSDDEGATWTEVEQPFLAAPFQRLDGLMVVGERLLANIVNDECCSQPVWGGYATSDLEVWEPIVLPEAKPDTWPWLVEDAMGTVWAIDTQDADGNQTWVTTDGDDWRLIAADSGVSRGYMGIDGVLHALPDGPFASSIGTTSEEINGIRRLGDSGWEELDPDSGQWGDGNTSMSNGVHDPESGRFFGIVGRTIRASAHYCYENVTTCIEGEQALVTSADGIAWHDLTPPPATSEFWRGGHLFWTNTRVPAIAMNDSGTDRNAWVVFYWSGSGLPSLIDPPSYPPPAAPAPFFDYRVGLEIGDEVRFAWPLGRCGGPYVDDIRWLPTEDPDMRDWPIREVNIIDGPSGYAYGRLRRVAADELEFFIEGSDDVVTLSPQEGEDSCF